MWQTLTYEQKRKTQRESTVKLALSLEFADHSTVDVKAVRALLRDACAEAERSLGATLSALEAGRG